MLHSYLLGYIVLFLWFVNVFTLLCLIIIIIVVIIIIIIIIIIPWEFFTPAFYWSLSDSDFLQVTRTLLSILADLNNAVVWMVSTCLLISKSSSPFTNPLGIVPSASITILTTVGFMFHIFLFSCKVKIFISLFTFF